MSREPLSRISIYMFDSDLDLIDKCFGKSIDRSKIIRSIVRAHLKKILSKSEENYKKPSVDVGDLDDLEASE